MKNSKGILGIILALVMMISLAFVPCKATAAEPIVIAGLDALSGPFRDVGLEVLMLAEYAVDQINAKGGLLGRPVKLVKYDTQMKPAVAVRNAKKAILEDGAKFIVHNSSSAIALGLSKVAKQYDVIYVDMHAEADKITGSEFTPNIFRTCLNTAMHSGALAHYFTAKPYKRYYLINQDYAFGHAVASSFRKVFEKTKPAGAEIVGEEYHPIANKDFGPYITKILASKADVVISGNWGVDLSGLIKQGRAMGLKAVIGTYFLSDTLRMNELRETALGCVTAESYMTTVKTKKNQEFLKSWQAWYKEHYPDETPLYILPGNLGTVVNAMYFLFEVIQQADSIEAAKIIETWEGMSFDGLVGKVKMRACDHQIQTPAFIAKIVTDHPQKDILDFPYVSDPDVIPAEKLSVPPAETGNPRCK